MEECMSCKHHKKAGYILISEKIYFVINNIDIDKEG